MKIWHKGTEVFSLFKVFGLYLDVNPDTVSKEHFEQVLDYLNNDDTESLKGMFCKKIKSSDKIKLDADVKKSMEQACSELGLSIAQEIKEGRLILPSMI